MTTTGPSGAGPSHHPEQANRDRYGRRAVLRVPQRPSKGGASGGSADGGLRSAEEPFSDLRSGWLEEPFFDLRSGRTVRDTRAPSIGVPTRTKGHQTAPAKPAWPPFRCAM